MGEAFGALIFTGLDSQVSRRGVPRAIPGVAEGQRVSNTRQDEHAEIAEIALEGIPGVAKASKNYDKQWF